MKAILIFVLLLTYLKASSDQYALGEEIYKKTCMSCHGVNGEGSSKVRFIVNPRDLRKTVLREEQAFKIIKFGAHEMGAAADIMPGFGNVLSDVELRAVTHYIYKKFDPQADERVKKLYSESDKIPEEKQAKMLKRGKKIYNRNCSWCHGATGHGNGEATRNPEMSIFPYDLVKTLLDEKQIFLYSKYGGPYWGTEKEDMPSWKAKYDDYTLKSVTRYITSELQGKK